MAQRIQIVLVCDMCEDGKPGQSTMSFGVDNANYTIDLCDKHAKGLRDALAPFVGAGRRSVGGGRRGRRGGGSADRQRTQDIRSWARKSGLKVSERGRISAEIAAQYDAAQAGK